MNDFCTNSSSLLYLRLLYDSKSSGPFVQLTHPTSAIDSMKSAQGLGCSTPLGPHFTLNALDCPRRPRSFIKPYFQIRHFSHLA
nr:hypothetical protein Q903MT_gene3174 [Picea sitchensis]